MMTINQLLTCIHVANRFSEAASDAIDRLQREGVKDDNDTLIVGTKETGAVRRASLDLTRALADLRRRG